MELPTTYYRGPFLPLLGRASEKATVVLFGQHACSQWLYVVLLFSLHIITYLHPYFFVPSSVVNIPAYQMRLWGKEGRGGGEEVPAYVVAVWF